MTLTAEQKAANRFDRMLEKSKELSPARYLAKFVAKDFQRMIRAEAGAKEENAWAVSDGCIGQWYSPLRHCMCVTCAENILWRGTNLLDAGHFLAGRYAAIVLEETNCHPQCVRCNTHGKDDTAYETYMLNVYGQDEIDRLRALKNGKSEPPDREDLVRKRIEYLDRIKVAELAMQQN